MNAEFRDLSPKRQCHIAIQARALRKAAEELARLKETTVDAMLVGLMFTAKTELENSGEAEIKKFVTWFDDFIVKSDRNE